VTPEEFDAHFDRFRSTAFRLEALPVYDVEYEREEFEAWRRGEPPSERSIRTEPWLARIALTTLTAGKRWTRVHVVDEPLSDYLRYELASYAENQAAGEEIRIARRADDARLSELPPDFWLFDAGTPAGCALAMKYDAAGRWLGAELVTDPGRLDEYQQIRDLVWTLAAPLNAYLALSGSLRDVGA
jgi:hypothetical protein